MEILLVEDDMADQMLTRLAFEKAVDGVRLDCCDDGARAFDSLRSAGDDAGGLPDILLSDMGLPGLGGHELLQQIKADDDLCHLPVIILSGNLSQQEIARSYQLGASAHITKPSCLQGYQELADFVVAAWTPTGFCFAGESGEAGLALRA